MKKLSWLLPFILFACKKTDNSMNISVQQQPSAISVYSVDTLTGVETPEFEIRYFNNRSTRQFDSIRVAGTSYTFDYSQLTSNHKILLNYVNASLPYSEINLDSNQYTLTSFNEINPSPGTNVTNLFQYNELHRITNYSYSATPSDGNFSRTYTYSIDTCIARTQRPFDACDTRDTIYNSIYDMSSSLPWLLLTDVNSSCGGIGMNILKAVPVSGYPNKLPSRIRNGSIQISFAYTGDSNYRLALADAVQLSTSTGATIAHWKIHIAY